MTLFIEKFKDISDEEIYQELKKIDETEGPFMKSEDWKKQRLIEIKKEGKVWSK